MTWDIQLEIAGILEGKPDTDDGPGAGHLIGGAHLINRFDGGAWGVFAAASYTRAADTDARISHFVGGAEFARFFGRFLLAGQIGGQTVIGGDADNTWSPGAFGTVSGRYFQTDNTVWSGKLGIGGFGDFDGDEDALWGQWGVDFEHRFDGTPLSFVAAYQGDILKDLHESDWEDNLINHTLKAGIRLTFGGNSDTILSAAQSGAATFALPDLHQPFAYTDDLW